ncbi:hypothetical protein [Bradyrhizobium sp. ERR14]|uniref:hypothetical protein n=1 Tax=Bradyrhizobium sp. ERR14 TaxID=2663837 RepID=UPI003908022D
MKARWPVGSQCQRCGRPVPLLRTRRLYTCRKLMCGDRSGFGAEVVVSAAYTVWAGQEGGNNSP